MSVLNENEILEEVKLNVANKMVAAARTAPKGRGINNMECKIITGDDIVAVAEVMKRIAKEEDFHAFERDAENILTSGVVVLFASKIKALGLKKCGLCGFKNCTEKNKFPEVPCSFNSGDLGIAIGSAVSIAMDNRIDNRIMYTVGQAVIELGIFTDEYKIIYGVPLSATSKNPFFDRK